MPIKEINVGKIAALMEKWAPVSLAEEFDNVGLLVGDSSRPVSRVLTALDAADSVIDEAIDKNCQMLVTHHPLFRTGLKKLNDSDFTAKKIMKLIENKIALYSAHTNLDKAAGGVNDTIARLAGLAGVYTGEDGFMRIGLLETPMTFSELSQKIAGIINAPYLPVVGDAHRLIKKVAVVGGSGMSLFSNAVNENVDLFMTGDVKYHDANLALDAGICLMDLTHYSGEAVVVPEIKRYLDEEARKHLYKVEVLVSEINAQPLKLL